MERQSDHLRFIELKAVFRQTFSVTPSDTFVNYDNRNKDYSTVRGTNRGTVSGGTGSAGQGTVGPSLPTPTTRTSAADQVPDPSLAALEVTQTTGQVPHQLISTLTVAQLA